MNRSFHFHWHNLSTVPWFALVLACAMVQADFMYLIFFSYFCARFVLLQHTARCHCRRPFQPAFPTRPP
jgi:hypothetical protein